jgi:hypothetical protein
MINKVYDWWSVFRVLYPNSNKFLLCFEQNNNLVTSIIIRPTASTIMNQDCYTFRKNLRVITKSHGGSSSSKYISVRIIEIAYPSTFFIVVSANCYCSSFYCPTPVHNHNSVHSSTSVNCSSAYYTSVHCYALYFSNFVHFYLCLFIYFYTLLYFYSL